jgi:hypothetical protein
MPEKILISFKQTDLEQKIIKFLKEQSALIGPSAYVKQLIYEDMLKKSPKEE